MWVPTYATWCHCPLGFLGTECRWWLLWGWKRMVVVWWHVEPAWGRWSINVNHHHPWMPLVLLPGPRAMVLTHLGSSLANPTQAPAATDFIWSKVSLRKAMGTSGRRSCNGMENNWHLFRAPNWSLDKQKTWELVTVQKGSKLCRKGWTGCLWRIFPLPALLSISWVWTMGIKKHFSSFMAHAYYTFNRNQGNIEATRWVKAQLCLPWESSKKKKVKGRDWRWHQKTSMQTLSSAERFQS